MYVHFGFLDAEEVLLKGVMLYEGKWCVLFLSLIIFIREWCSLMLSFVFPVLLLSWPNVPRSSLDTFTNELLFFSLLANIAQ